MSSRGTWGSRLGFILAVAGSAVGLANIWRFPFLVGQYGGSAFVMLYLLCLVSIGFPVFFSEIFIGKSAGAGPARAFRELSLSPAVGGIGFITICTGFLVSSFYSAIAGWILGYLIGALSGDFSLFTSVDSARVHFFHLLDSSFWTVSYHFLFMSLSAGVVYFGIQGGIERGCKVMMPLLLGVLMLLALYGLTLPGARFALAFLFSPNWQAITPVAVLMALGQSFFTLSVGQGTLVTYGSYLDAKENPLFIALPVICFDTVVSLLAAVTIFTIAYSVGVQPDAGEALLFITLPWVFSQLSGGILVAALFFFLVFLAALTSQISALEPAITYLVDERGWRRHPATAAVAGMSFLVGIPCALSSNLLSGWQPGGFSLLDLYATVCSNLLIPLGGLAAVLLVGWSRLPKQLLAETLEANLSSISCRKAIFFSVRWLAPISILMIFLHAINLL